MTFSQSCRISLVIIALALFPSLASADALAPEDYQAALVEANSQIAGLSNRAQQLAVQVAQQGREIAKLKADVEKAAKPSPSPSPSPDAPKP